MDKLSYVVDGSLGAVPLDKMCILRNRMQAGKTLGSSNPIASDRPLVVGSQQLEANVLYPASNNPNVRYYLPLYKVAADGAKPDVELRYSGSDGGDAGRLTIGLTWDPPAAPAGVELRAMDHQAELELRFLIPVQGGGSSAGQDSVPLQPLQQEAGGRARAVTVFSGKAQFDAVYQALRDEDRQATLHIRITARVGAKTWQQVTLGGSPSKQQQIDALERRGALFTRVFNPATLATVETPKAGASSARMVVKPVEQEEQVRVQAVRTMMAEPPTATRFQAHTVDRSVTAEQPAPQTGAAAAPLEAKAVSPVVMRAFSPTIRMARVAPAVQPATAQPAFTVAHLDAGAFAAAQPAKPAAAQPATSGAAQPAAAASFTPQKLTLSAATLSMVHTPALAQAMAVSDLQIKNLVALPVQIALGNNGEPAIIDTVLESQQSLAFHFDADAPANHDVFATLGFDSGGIHLLLTLLLTVNGRSQIVYQDNLMREVVHVAPAEFRLVRDREAPYLPGLTFLPADFGTTGGDASEAELLFQMVMNYRLEPWIDPDTIEAARIELARQGLAARFTPILPREAKLALDLDVLGTAQQRDKATVEPATGITDTLVLDNDVFTQIWRERLARAGACIGGRVRYRLFDGTEAESAVSISFWETSAGVLDVDFLGSAGTPDRYRVNVRNRIESPVTIERLPAVTLEPGVVANPVDAGSVLNRKLLPQQSVQIDYQVTPAGTPVVSIAPLVLGTVEPNLSTLLKVLMLSPGYKSLSFTVPVSAASGVFGTTQGTETLIGLLVEFDDGSRAELTAEAPATEVTLVGRLIDQILGTTDDQHRYLYRVTNIHPSGEGARSSWREGQGATPLQVGAAIVQLDF